MKITRRFRNIKLQEETLNVMNIQYIEKEDNDKK
jgi:hypothetical protein